MTDSSSDEQKYYRYNPSLAAAIIFIVLFVLTSTFHFYQMVRTKTWYFIPFVVGACFEWIGYIGRAISSQESPNWTLGPYLIQTLFILLGPALFAASIYMELGRIILLTHGEKHSIIKKRWLTKFFVLGDVISFFTQASGGSTMASGKPKDLKSGENIVIGGLLLQIFFFGFFIVVAIVFDRRIRKHPTAQSSSPSIPWRKHLIALYFASTLILVRNVFRIIEYIQGNDGYILRHEYYLYIFDATLMFFVMLIFNIAHPSEVHALLRGGMVSRGFRMIALKEIESQESPLTEESGEA